MRAWIVLGLLGVLSWVAAGCSDRSDPEPEPEAADDADAGMLVVPVETTRVETGEMRRLVVASTTLRSRLEMPVLAETAGIVVTLAVERGDRVEAGQVLARIENQDASIALREARMLVERWERELEAIRPLYEEGFLARQQWEDVRFQREQARTQVARAERVRATQTVRAPRAGVVLDRSVERGGQVVPNQTLLTLADVDDLEAVISVPERELANVREGQAAEFVIAALGDAVVRGVVDRIEPVVDPRTGTIDVRVRLDAEAQPEGLPRIRPGMFVQVRVTTDVRSGVPVLPKRALVHEGDTPWAWVVEPIEVAGEATGIAVAAEGSRRGVRRVALELGYEESARVEIRSGLSPGDEVVIAGQSALSEDAVVQVVPPRGAAGRPATSEGSGSGEAPVAEDLAPAPDSAPADGEAPAEGGP